MRKFKLFLLISAICLVSATRTAAYDIEVDGIYYNICSESALEVTSGEEMYQGDISIPSDLWYNDILYSVKRIGDNAFAYCSSLTSVSVPNSVESIGLEAFGYCSELTVIEIPSSVKEIGEGVFMCCSNLRKISVDRSNQQYKIVNEGLLTADGELLLVVPAKNANLNETYVVPDGVKRIGNYAFVNNSYINRIELPEGVLSIGDMAFGALMSGGHIEVLLPKSLEKIGSNIFLANFNADIKIDILATTPPVVSGGFGASSTMFISVPKGAKEAYNVAPWNGHTIVERVEINEVFEVDGISYKKISEEACEVVGRVDNSAGIVQIPAEVNYSAQVFHVTAIGANAFEDDIELTNVVIPASVVSIGDNAFGGCSNLAAFTMVDAIPPATGDAVFDGCSKLTAIYVPEEAKDAYDVAPWNSYAITEIPKEGTSFEVDGFTYLVNGTLECALMSTPEETLELVIPPMVEYSNLPYNVTSIGTQGWGPDIHCTSVVIPNTLRGIYGFAFQDCPLTSIFIPSSVEFIDVFTFSGCKELTSIIVDPQNRVYDSREDCNAIIETSTNTLVKGCNNTIIPSSVTQFGRTAFRGSGIESISIPNSVTSIANGAFFKCDRLSSVIIPNSVTEIDVQAFGDCYSLRHVSIPNSVSSFGLGAFSNCMSLKSVTIPTTIQDIGMITFSNSMNLSKVIMLGDTPPAEMPYGSSVFYLCHEDLTFYVPIGAEEAYQNWSSCPAEGTHMLIEPSPCTQDVEVSDCNVAYNRTFEDTNWQAWYAPFDMVYDEDCEDFVVARLGDILHFDDDWDGSYDRWQLQIIRLNKGDVIEANRPYVIRANYIANSTFLAENTTLHVAEEREFECTSEIGEYTIRGVYNQEESGVGPYRWYLQDENGNVYTLDDISLFDEEVWRDDAGIESITLSPTITLMENVSSVVLEAVITPFYAADKYIEWSLSSDNYSHNGDRIVNLKQLYLLDALNPGKVTLTATAKNGVSASCEVIVLGTPQALTLNYDGEAIFAETIAHGDSLKSVLNQMRQAVQTLPQPTKEGYTLEWKFVDSKDGSIYGYDDFLEIMPERDLNLTLTPTFVINNYLVAFIVDGEVVYSGSLPYGSEIVAPEVPEREGYTFNGWGEIAETVPAGDVTYEGSYSINTYLLTYTVDGETVQADSVVYGTAITALAEPTKEGHTFSGWSEVPATMPAKDVTISGVFTINTYLVTFKIGDEVIASDSLTYGAAIVAPEAPEKEGYTFNGWGEVAETVPAGDLTYEGSYTANIYKVYYYVGEELVHTAEVIYGETIPEYIYEPTEEGYTFLGWLGEVYETMPAHDVTYTANIESGINQLPIDNGQLTIYDLMGRKVTDTENLKGGIYIVNGKKVVIK